MYGVYCDWMSVWSDVRLRGDKVRVTGSEEYTETQRADVTNTAPSHVTAVEPTEPACAVT